MCKPGQGDRLGCAFCLGFPSIGNYVVIEVDRIPTERGLLEGQDAGVSLLEQDEAADAYLYLTLYPPHE